MKVSKFKVLLYLNSAVDNLIKRNVDFMATTVKEMMQGTSMDRYMVQIMTKVTELTNEYRAKMSK